MELSALSENIIDVPYKRGDEVLTLRVNIDAFTPQFWRELKKIAEGKLKTIKGEMAEFKKVGTVKGKVTPEQAIKEQFEFMEIQAKELESARDTNIDFLIPHILKGWDATDKGVPVPLTKEVLRPLPPRLVQELLDVCVKASRTVKKTGDEEGTQASTQDGSPVLRVVGQST